MPGVGIPPGRMVGCKSTQVVAPQVEVPFRSDPSFFDCVVAAIQHSEPAPGRVMAQSDHRSFQKHVGRAVDEEIDRQRIEHAKKLVRETRHKLHVIARLSGFSGAEHFSRTFRRVTGAPPSAYRRRLRSAGESP